MYTKKPFKNKIRIVLHGKGTEYKVFKTAETEELITFLVTYNRLPYAVEIKEQNLIGVIKEIQPQENGLIIIIEKLKKS